MKRGIDRDKEDPLRMELEDFVTYYEMAPTCGVCKIEMAFILCIANSRKPVQGGLNGIDLRVPPFAVLHTLTEVLITMCW